MLILFSSRTKRILVAYITDKKEVKSQCEYNSILICMASLFMHGFSLTYNLEAPVCLYRNMPFIFKLQGYLIRLNFSAAY